MCFSATASLAAGGVLGALGVASLVKVKDCRWYPVAAIPVLFAAQQVCEGVVWLYQPLWAIYGFLFFAMVIWPVWMPFSLLLLARKKQEKKLLERLLGFGTCLAAYLLFCMVLFTPTADAQGCHILYRMRLYQDLSVYLVGFLYCIATIVPFFVSHVKYMRLFGVLTALSCIIAYIFFTVYFTSVWCFFTALLSACVFFMLP